MGRKHAIDAANQCEPHACHIVGLAYWIVWQVCDTARCAKCLVPGFDGTLFTSEWKDALWGARSPWERHDD